MRSNGVLDIEMMLCHLSDLCKQYTVGRNLVVEQCVCHYYNSFI